MSSVLAEGGAPTGGDGGGAPGGAANDSWAAALDEDQRGWVSGMGLDKLDEKGALAKVLPMYRAAEQKLGVPADQLLRMPKDENDAEGFRAAMMKLGLPEKADDYGLPVPEGDKGEFAKMASGWMHEIGVPKRQAVALAAKWNEHVAAMATAQEGQYQQSAETDIAALKSEWKGEEYDKNVALAQRVRKTAGLTDQEAIALERAIGVKRAATVFASLGKSLGEHRFAEGTGGAQSFGMTAEGARARIADLQKDSAWVAAYTAGDADKKAEFTRLMQIAHPEDKAA